MKEAEFNEYYDKYYIKNKTIQKIARKLSQQDLDLYDDLVQIGLMTLWMIDPSKAKTNKDSWIRQAIRFKMIDHLTEMDPRKYVSLDSKLEEGYQIESTVDGPKMRNVQEKPNTIWNTDEVEEHGQDIRDSFRTKPK